MDRFRYLTDPVFPIVHPSDIPIDSAVLVMPNYPRGRIPGH